MSFYGVSKFFVSIIFKLFFKISVVGKCNVDCELGGLILVSNHRSNLDPFVLGLFSKRRLFFMAKKELVSAPVLGHIVKGWGAFPVKRGAHDFKAIDYAKKIVSSGQILALFPEGTRSKTGEISKFKSGAVRIAIASGCKLLPCSIFYVKGWFRRKIFLEYGKSITLQELANDYNLNLNNISRESLLKLNENLRSLIVKMNKLQQKLI